MEQHYKLFKIRELADNDEDFIKALASTFLEEVSVDIERLQKAVVQKDYLQTYQIAHKMKPTIDLFQLGVLDTLIEIQDWGKLVKTDLDIAPQLQVVVTAINKALSEIKSDFSL